MSMRSVNKRNEEINKVFEGFRRNHTADLDLPQNFLLLLEPTERYKGPRNRGGGGEGGGGGG